MPYYIYRITELGIAQKLDEAAGYRDAKQKLAAVRELHESQPQALVRMIFAANELEAEDLLSTPRSADPAASAEDD